MAENTYRVSSESAEKKSFFAFLDKAFRIDQSVAEVIHLRFLPQMFFIAAIVVVYIGNKHYAEKKVREISRLERRVADLRADYMTLNAAFKFSSKQSEVAKEAGKLGLIESDVPPFKIEVAHE